MKKALSTEMDGKRTPIAVWILAMAVGLVLLALVCLCLGQYSVSISQTFQILVGKAMGKTGDWKPMQENVILFLRLPRILSAGLVGAALALSGAVYQGIFRNPLVSPDLLGVSSGACVGAALAILLGLSPVMTEAMAFACGLAAVALTLLIPKLLGSTSNVMLVLSGVIVSGLMSSVLGMIKISG